MEHKILGVIGGMGPKATSVFFDKVVEKTDAHKDQDHIDMVILNHASIPDRTEVILKKKEETFLKAIHKDIKLLELAEVDHIAIPCNTSHYFYEDLQEMTDIDIIHMVDETVKKIFETYGANSKVGIMATNGTISSGIYEKSAKKFNIDLNVPNQALQDQIMKIIYNDIKNDLTADTNEIEAIIHDFIFEQDCSCVILACTEFSVITLSDEVQNYCVDAMDVLVERSIELSGKQLKSLQQNNSNAAII
ncbi:aspartate/glutamate racemase family protein [Chengkuizengella sediminis]|uniref:aspartate/glutamate racemase family protein n=1 Tax=Chengkuizengella sediminis TaxID=1885917 RepID=UPI001389998F|nr:amino acid racemase [Chengkuizengella sediminis]NDI35173.1 amino acid racemase [Chengkuizengella sediminis]